MASAQIVPVIERNTVDYVALKAHPMHCTSNVGDSLGEKTLDGAKNMGELLMSFKGVLNFFVMTYL